jgi:citrate synthase
MDMMRGALYIVNLDCMINMSSSSHLTARQAADELGVSLATLYAYVSRGMVRSEPAPGESRRRRYARVDVERLKRRREVRSDPSRAAEGSLGWGEPVVESALTLIDGGRLYYRGRDAVELAAAGRPLEAVAALLWSGDEAAAERLFAGPRPDPGTAAARLAGQLGHAHPVDRCQALLPLAGAADPAAWDLRPAAAAATGARILRLVALLLAGTDLGGPERDEERATEPPAADAAGVLAAAWGLREPAAVAAVRAALVLCADHELNVSAFTARCVASAGASPYDAVAAGLGALKGGRHGGAGERVQALLAEAGDKRRARAALGDRLRRGEEVPGFGHPLYPEGDPRAAALLARADAVTPDPGRLELIHAVVAAAADLLGERPTLDVGLVALARALGLPPESPLVLFAAGRTAGWIGHAVEEYSRGRLIRPRARYTGPPPEPPAGPSPGAG